MKLFGLLVAFMLLAVPGVQAQDWAKAKLEKSPRHLDWATVKSGGRDVKCFIAHPESKRKTAAILVIHENVGLADWVRSICDDIAQAGYIAIAADLLGQVYTTQDDARKAVAELKPEQVTADLDAAAAYARQLPSCNKSLAVAGFCWGGGQAFRYATNNEKLAGAFVFYGMPANAADMSRIKCPVYGFYGGNDARITSTVEQTEKDMKAARKKYFPETYAGAGHGFMRSGEAPDASAENKEARAKAWGRFTAALSKVVK